MSVYQEYAKELIDNVEKFPPPEHGEKRLRNIEILKDLADGKSTSEVTKKHRVSKEIIRSAVYGSYRRFLPEKYYGKGNDHWTVKIKKEFGYVSIRAMNALHNMDIWTKEEFKKIYLEHGKPYFIKEVPNLGQKTLDEILDACGIEVQPKTPSDTFNNALMRRLAAIEQKLDLLLEDK